MLLVYVTIILYFFFSKQSHFMIKTREENCGAQFSFLIVSMLKNCENFPALLVSTSYSKRQRHSRGMMSMMSYGRLCKFPRTITFQEIFDD